MVIGCLVDWIVEMELSFECVGCWFARFDEEKSCVEKKKALLINS